MRLLFGPLIQNLIIVLAINAFGCSGEPRNSDVPDDIREVDNVTIYSTDNIPEFEIYFEHEISMGDSPERPIGRMGGVAVDELGRVYISDLQKKELLVFESNGEFLTTIGRSGSGPGEYMGVPMPTVKPGKLFVLDPMRLMLNLYSTDGFELVQTINLNPTNAGSFYGIGDTYVRQITVLNEETFLITLSSYIRTIADKPGKIMDDKYLYFFLMSNDGKLITPLTEPVPLYEVTGEVAKEFQFSGPIARVAPSPDLFTTPLIAVSEKGDIFTANSDQIFIRKYSIDGTYQRAFYHHFEHLKMVRDDAINAQATSLLADVVSQNELPETWPAMDRFIVDNEGRFWLATIVEKLSIHEWWILDQTGELITKFDWPRSEPLVEVKNGYMYTRQTDQETGLQQIVKYRIEIK